MENEGDRIVHEMPAETVANVLRLKLRNLVMAAGPAEWTLQLVRSFLRTHHKNDEGGSDADLLLLEVNETQEKLSKELDRIYSILGLPRAASPEEFEKAFKELGKR